MISYRFGHHLLANRQHSIQWSDRCSARNLLSLILPTSFGSKPELSFLDKVVGTDKITHSKQYPCVYRQITATSHLHAIFFSQLIRHSKLLLPIDQQLNCRVVVEIVFAIDLALTLMTDLKHSGG